MKIYTNDLVKGHSDVKVKCLTFGLYTQVSDSGPLGPLVFSSPELAQGELLGYRDVRRPSYVWTSVTSETSETYETSETSVRQLFSLCTL